MAELDDIRKKINDLDAAIIAAFEERMKCSGQVAEYKIKNGMEVLDRRREKEVIKRSVGMLKDKTFTKDVVKLMEQIMEASRACQNRVIRSHNKGTAHGKTVDMHCVAAFQGEKGANSEAALMDYFGNTVDMLACGTFEDVFAAVRDGKAGYGVVPIENSSTGSIVQVYDLLGKYDGIKIAGEQRMLIEHNLLGLDGAGLEDITDVYSHEQALMQCAEFLNGTTFVQHPYFNTAVSAKYVAETGNKKNAAIASSYAARIYGLDILASDISTSQDNTTRFIIISNDGYEGPDANKASVIFVLEHKPGALANVLNTFAEKGLNMVKLESRPLENHNFEYAFHVDFEGDGIKDIIDGMVRGEEGRELFTYIKMLGAYKKRSVVEL